MALGINAYVSDADWPPPPEWFAAWFAQARWPFQKAVLRDTDRLAAHLTGPCGAFSGQSYGGAGSIFHTNAIKTHLRESEGKRAGALAPDLFADHAADFRAELELMAQHAVLPHVVIVFGSPFWPFACDAIGKLAGAARVDRHEFFPGPMLPFVNRYRVVLGGRTQDVLLVRVRHPSARTHEGGTRWLLSDPDFRLAAGCDVPAPTELPESSICRRVAAFEGGQILAGVARAGPFVAVDSGTMRDLLDESDGFTASDLFRLQTFPSTADRRAFLGGLLARG